MAGDVSPVAMFFPEVPLLRNLFGNFTMFSNNRQIIGAACTRSRLAFEKVITIRMYASVIVALSWCIRLFAALRAL